MHLANMDENDSDTGSNRESDEDEGSDFHFHDDSLYSTQQAVKPITNVSTPNCSLNSNLTLQFAIEFGWSAKTTILAE